MTETVEINRPLRIDEAAPEFTARTTQGERSLRDHRGRWLILFSHPADFTPVCTSEFVAFAKAAPSFAELGCDLLALSVDSLYAHLAWIRDIRDRFGVEIPFPIIEDTSLVIARAYGMVAVDAADSATVRATYVIDPLGKVRAISWYPLSVGRCVGELLRLLTALQTGDREKASTPEGWRPGEPMLEPALVTAQEVLGAPDAQGGWYYRERPA